MKKRLVSSLALAGALSLGLVGCSTLAPVATDVKYAPSDGVDIDSADGTVNIRNFMLLGEEGSSDFNAVFVALTEDGQPAELSVVFEGDSGESVEETISIKESPQPYGDDSEGAESMTVSLPDQKIGSTVDVFVTMPDGSTVESAVPVLDGTLEEYSDLTGGSKADNGESADEHAGHNHEGEEGHEGHDHGEEGHSH